MENEITELTFPTSLKMIEKSNQDYIQWHWNNLIVSFPLIRTIQK